MASSIGHRKRNACVVSDGYEMQVERKADMSSVPASWNHDDKTLLEKLFSSKEERSFLIPHLHKILGFSCLGSFVYRFTHMGASDGNFGPHSGTLFFIVHHWLLNASSFIFAIPQRRIQDGGFRIWPEYRIHSLVFASRSLAFMLLMWYEQMHGIPPNSRRVYQHMDLLLVLATCACADFGSYLQGKHHSNTVREATFSDPFELWFASEMQLYLTALCIVGYRRYTLHLLAVAVIQTNSFLMTLRRKNVAPHFVLTACYTLLLVGGFVVMGYDDVFSHRTGVGGTVGGIAALLRMGPLRVNKYVLWTALWIVWYYVRNRNVVAIVNTIFWLYGLVITKTLSTLLGLIKRSQAPQESRSKVVAFLIFATHAALYGYLYVVNWGMYRRRR